MSFLSFDFLIFFGAFIYIYYLVPSRYRYLCILLGSYIFYGYNDPKLVIFLFVTTLITYLGGLVVARNQNKILLAVFVISNFLILAVFKYSGFLFSIVSRFLSDSFVLSANNIISGMILPVGLSFYIFQSTTYLIDAYRKKIKPEKNLFLYAAFVSFFPTVLSGPIQKAKEFLPKLKAQKNFDVIDAKKGVILFIWGWFEKKLVANKLSVIVYGVYSNIEGSKGPSLLLAMLCYSLYIYADFSAYSDMAIGIAKILGIDIGKNFNNPYLSKSLSEFWTRWHTSLNNWLVDYLYIPLGGNRKGKVRKYINVMIVFLISGLWHGAYWHFVTWGAVNGLLVVIGNALADIKNNFYKKLGIDENLESIVFLKRAGVFIAISFTWMLFDRGFSDVRMILEKISAIHLAYFFDENLINIAGDFTSLLVTIIFVVFFCVVQCCREREAHYFERFDKQPIFVQCFIMALLLIVCVYASVETTTVTNNEFLYFEF